MYPLADILIRIKNAQMAKKERLLIPFSRLKWDIVRILKERGFIDDFERRKKKAKKTEQVSIEIKLNMGPARTNISGVKIVSKPSRRIYVKKNKIRTVLGGYGLALISTSQGIMSGEEARKNNLGGEWLAEIW